MIETLLEMKTLWYGNSNSTHNSTILYQTLVTFNIICTSMTLMEWNSVVSRISST
uniref:AlNc14C80G5280 protein n=1 Tax=Albugo laibachii Nc14 TaxID=890382 RepID=F0WF88_9STRA|nr:AlNc14C80G5280 [Albugo laibachii Nc14]|eukprot:CCA19870.1 AlNc14C80G5280 [Albugo laibachii Nc14]